MKKEQQNEFWITNISNKNVMLADLAFSIKAKSSYNLLDANHFSYTLSQLQQSSESGSIYKKRRYIKIRKSAPKIYTEPGVYMSQQNRTVPSRTNVKIKEEHYDELNLSDEQFASDFAEAGWNEKATAIIPHEDKESK